VARLAGARSIIYTPQTVDVRRARWHGLYRSIERNLAHMTDIIVSVNEYDRQRLIEWGIPPQKIVTIPNGIDLTEFEALPETGDLRQALGMDTACPLVLQVGRLSPQKDPLAFVEGAAHVLRRLPNAQFALVGDGPLGDALTTSIKELDLEDHVHLLGWRVEAPRLMAAANVVTLTSRWEGAPYALLEAMACSRPVVATAVNGCPEIVIDGLTGFVVLPNDTASWARSVIDLLLDPLKATRMGKEGRLRVEEEFSMPQMIERIEELYLRAKEGAH
jgi:glycosyltransferase involved in cell wall biosynthesis